MNIYWRFSLGTPTAVLKEWILPKIPSLILHQLLYVFLVVFKVAVGLIPIPNFFQSVLATVIRLNSLALSV